MSQLIDSTAMYKQARGTYESAMIAAHGKISTRHKRMKFMVEDPSGALRLRWAVDFQRKAAERFLQERGGLL